MKLKSKTVWINFRSTTEDRNLFRKDAHRHEMTMTEYFEWLVEKERKDMYNDIVDGNEPAMATKPY